MGRPVLGAREAKVPELPDITIYVEALERRIRGQKLEQIRLGSPFLLRSIEPKLEATFGQTVREIRRVGKRIALSLENDLALVVHLMVAGRLHWKKLDAKLAPRRDLAFFCFADGILSLTEAGTKRRASLHVVAGEAGIAALDPGGVEPLSVSLDSFADALRRENHTLKRVLTDPRTFSGIGNAYSDEILHSARLSPIALSQKLNDEEVERLYCATRDVLHLWTERLRIECGSRFPEKVTAFRPEMAVHGKYGQPCPVCATRVQRIRHAENETNYCPQCQTSGKLLADRGLSRLLKSDWPRSLDDWDEHLQSRKIRPK